MNLYVLRHAIAAQRGLPEYEDDSQRPLTGKGKRKMEKIAKGMRLLGLKFDLILSSPYVRARQTAEIVADEFELADRLVLSDTLTPEASSAALVAELNERYGEAQNVVVVGHEPYLSTLISTLVGCGPNAAIDLKKGGLCCLSAEALVDGPCATLEWLLAPRHLVRLC